MNNYFNFYYGINVFEIFSDKGIFSFNYNGINYYFVEYDRDKKDIKSIVSICEELKKRNIITNELVLNKFNGYITPYNNLLYVLIKENSRKYKININDVLYIQNNTYDLLVDNNMIRNNYIDLWKTKIDFYEKKIIDIRNKNKLIDNTFDFFVGLGENAIVYLTNNNVRISHFVLSHRRIDEKRNSFDFYNPLNYILDNRARDIADFIKSIFFYESISKEVIFNFLNYINFNREEYILFIARMLYPTYYFDMIDKIIINNESEVILKKIIDKTNDYINLIEELFYYINNNLRMNIPIIEWIIKK